MVRNEGKKPDRQQMGRVSFAISKIELLGIGSLRFQQLRHNLKEALNQLQIDIPVEEVTDVDVLMGYDIGGIPALVIDGRVLFQRVVPEVEDIKDVFTVLLQADAVKKEKITHQAVLAEQNRKAGLMKKILVPTDFSKCAMNALGYAVDIANQFGCKITLLNTYRTYSTSGMFVSVEKHIEKDIAENMLSIIKKIEPRLRNGASIESKIVEGEAISLIKSIADKSRYDLIIMGTKGATGLKEVFTGSITNGVIKSTTTPVLAVPEDFDYQPMDRIVFAIDDLGLSGPKVSEPLVKVAQGFGAHVHVFHHAERMKKEEIDPVRDIYLENLETSVHYELNGNDPIESVVSFVEDIGAGLLVMVRHKRGFLEEVFHVSATTKTVFDSPVPLLILKD